MSTVTKIELAEKIVEQGLCGIKEAVELVESTLETIKSSLSSGEDVLLSGFGKFHVRDKRARKGRNPKTGTEMTVAPRRVVTFHASNELRNKCKGSVLKTPSSSK